MSILSFFDALWYSASLSSAVFPLQTDEVTIRAKCHRSRWWIHRREAASASWRRPTLPMSSFRMLGRVSCPRRLWSVATPWPHISPPTPKTGWASLRYITANAAAAVAQNMCERHHQAFMWIWIDCFPNRYLKSLSIFCNLIFQCMCPRLSVRFLLIGHKFALGTLTHTSTSALVTHLFSTYLKPHHKPWCSCSACRKRKREHGGLVEVGLAGGQTFGALYEPFWFLLEPAPPLHLFILLCVSISLFSASC